jgi:predicted phosphodiesterase
LPLSLKLVIDGVQVEMMHILPVPRSELEEWSKRALVPDGRPPQRREAFLKTFDDATGVVIFGHSHQPSLTTLGRRLFLNPGSAGKKRFSLPRCCGLLEIFPDRIQASIRLLERYNGKVPGRIHMDIGE